MQPLDASGNPAENGRIVLLSVGLSNTTQEWSAFIPMAAADPERNPAVQPVDGAFGGWTASKIATEPDQYWPMVDQRLAAANATGNQVQAIWVLLAESNPTEPFPTDAQGLQADLVTVMRQARARFPNLKLAYLSSRIYAGYASTTLNPEPYAYESGFAVKWLIEQQLSGDPQLDPASGQAPYLLWGPYTWADGLKPRIDGLTWACSDFQSDGTHPSAAGAQKVARMLLDFFHSDATARTWFVAQPFFGRIPAPGTVVNSAGYGQALATGSLATIFGGDLAQSTAQATAYPLPHELAGTQVLVDGAPALLYYVSPGQINFVVPPTGGQSLVVVSSGRKSAAVTLQTGFWAPGLFTLDGTPTGPVAAAHADGTAITDASPAHAGETIQAYGTGMGIINPLLKIAVPAPIVTVGGKQAQVTYAGPAPALPGVTQINFVVPDVTGTARVVFQLGTTSSNGATLRVQ